MTATMTSQQILDRYFLEMRCKVLDVAAALDRLNLADEAARFRTDARIQNLRKAIAILLEENAGRAERVQMIFSDAYESTWERPSNTARHAE